MCGSHRNAQYEATLGRFPSLVGRACIIQMFVWAFHKSVQKSSRADLGASAEELSMQKQIDINSPSEHSHVLFEHRILVRSGTEFLWCTWGLYIPRNIVEILACQIKTR